MRAEESPQPPRRGWLAWIAWLATEDHCAWANQYVYWLKTPLGILVLCAVFSLLCGLFVAPQVLLLLAVLAAVVAIGLAWPGIAVRGLRCRLVFDARRGREGKPTRARLIVSNRWPWPVWGLAVDDPAFARAAGQGDGHGETSVALARIDGWSRSTYNWTFTPPLRGVYPSQEVRIVTGFPFGLRRASRPIEVEKKLIVWPESFWLPPLTDQLDRRDWGGELSESVAGADGARLGVREYRHGDSLRDVHWVKSARQERLVVSEREGAVVADYQVLVDVDPARHAGLGRDATLEWSLRVAASVCESVVGQRGRVELWLGPERHVAAAGDDSLQRLLDGVARWTAEEFPQDSLPIARRRAAQARVISIGTDASGSLAGRAIVLRRADSAAQALVLDGAAAPWIEVQPTGDVPGQVLKGWRSAKRRLRREG